MAKKKAVKKKAAAPVKKAKRQGRLGSLWVGPQRDQSIDTMFASALEPIKAATGMEGISLGTDMDRVIVGLPLPALCLRYIFQSTVFPLGRVIQFAGPFGSCKSALLYELMRWHFVYGGGGALAECENKDAVQMRHGILQYNPTWLRRITYGEANHLEQWQSFLTANLIQFQTALDIPGGPGRTIPICAGIDSLTAVDTLKESDKVTDAGFSSLGFAQQANLITRFMRQGVVHRLRGYPFTIAGTNHLKQKIETQGKPGAPPTNKSPGGEAINFMATFLVETRKIKDIDREDYEGIRIGMTMAKNSIGPSRKRIEAQLLWWQEMDRETQQFKQRFVWDWDTSTVELLLSFLEPKSTKKTLGGALKDITGIVKDPGGKAHSRVLGIREPVEYRVVGQALEQRPDLLAQIYPMMGISNYSVFQPGMDYRAMLESAQNTIAEAAPIYTENSNLPTLSPEDVGATTTFTPEAEEGDTITEMDEQPEDSGNFEGEQ